jgi:hypothetical protein
MDPQTIPLALPLEVVYWASSSLDDSTQKVKFCDVHPEFSWIVSAEKYTINVWDFLRSVARLTLILPSQLLRKDCLVEKSLPEILDSFERSKSHSKPSPSLTANNSFAANRTFHSSSSSSHGSFLQRIKSGNDPLDQLTLPPHLRSVGEIKRVAFVDRVAMQWNCGGISIPATLDSFHSSNRLMILCDNALLFYDFVSGATHAITPSDLNRVNICSAEFVYTNLCAIGGADGSIRSVSPFPPPLLTLLSRIWDCLHWKLVKTLTTTGRGEITTLRNLLPRRSGFDSLHLTSLHSRVGAPQATGASDSGLREGRIRLLSIGKLPSLCDRRHYHSSAANDGSGLLWDSLVMGNIIQINEPTGHLLSQGSFAQHLDDASDTLITVSQDRTMRSHPLHSPCALLTYLFLSAGCGT